jgi:ferric-dicitrate binding protein FerR (iron transport regulator)
MERSEGQRVVPAAETAAEWFVRIKDEQLSEAARREYAGWLRQSPKNIAETLRVCRLYGLLRASKLRAELTREDILSSIVDLYPPPGAACSRVQTRPAPATPWKVAALIVAIVLIAVLGLVFQHSML